MLDAGWKEKLEKLKSASIKVKYISKLNLKSLIHLSLDIDQS